MILQTISNMLHFSFGILVYRITTRVMPALFIWPGAYLFVCFLFFPFGFTSCHTLSLFLFLALPLFLSPSISLYIFLCLSISLSLSVYLTLFNFLFVSFFEHFFGVFFSFFFTDRLSLVLCIDQHTRSHLDGHIILSTFTPHTSPTTTQKEEIYYTWNKKLHSFQILDARASYTCVIVCVYG